MRNMYRLWALTMGCVVLVCASGVLGQDWPQWRGAGRDGKISGFAAPEKWPAGLTQKWKVTIGEGDATPALAGDRLYAFGRQDANEVVLCLNAGNGREVWREAYDAQHVVTGPAARHGGPRSSVAVANGKVITLGVGGILSCFDAATGKVQWRKQSTQDYLGINYDFDTSMSPLVAEGVCIVHIGGKGAGSLMAFDLATGDAKWKCDGNAPANSSPVLMTVDDVKQVVTLNEGYVIGVSLAEGKLLWQTPFAARQGNNATPVIDGQTVIVCGQNVGTQALKIERRGDGFAVTPLWSNELGPRFATPVLKDGRLYGFDVRFYCADARTGAKLWADNKARGQSGALLDGGSCLLALTSNCELAAFVPGDGAYVELACYKVAETETWAHPIVAGRCIYIRDKDSVALWTMD
jgi:outer membrane protein assembly factor BamB